MKIHMKLVAACPERSRRIAKVRAHVLGPLVSLGEQHSAGSMLVYKGAQPLQVSVGLGQVLAVGSLPLVQVGYRIHAESVHAQVHPEAEDIQHLLLHSGVVVV